MTTSFLIRRIHLYLGLVLFPWVLLYGLSSLVFAHSAYINRLDSAKNLPSWYTRVDRSYDAPVPTDAAGLRGYGLKLADEFGLTGANFSVSRTNSTTITVNRSSFLSAKRIIYNTAQKHLTVEERRFRFEVLLTQMHSRYSFPNGGFLQTLWSISVDAAAIAFILWIVTGLILWWSIRSHRAWGALTILAGLGSFALFTALL